MEKLIFIGSACLVLLTALPAEATTDSGSLLSESFLIAPGRPGAPNTEELQQSEESDTFEEQPLPGARITGRRRFGSVESIRLTTTFYRGVRFTQSGMVPIRGRYLTCTGWDPEQVTLTINGQPVHFAAEPDTDPDRQLLYRADIREFAGKKARLSLLAEPTDDLLTRAIAIENLSLISDAAPFMPEPLTMLGFGMAAVAAAGYLKRRTRATTH
ncbi:MAG: hypothetical protein ACLFVU_07695 [Phycisphaerae bacterium]